MKHTRRRTLTRNIFARLRPAVLSTNRGEFDRHKPPINRAARRKKPRVCHRNEVPQKVMDYYGFVSVIETDMWEIDFRDNFYIGVIEENGGQDWHTGHGWFRIDYHPKVRRLAKQKRNRNLRKFVKKYGLEHKLLHK